IALLGLGILTVPSVAAPPGPPPHCQGVCSTDCVKPLAIPDRWDDSGAPGWSIWANNGRWDGEAFTDMNGNRIWDPGEPFQDGRDQAGHTGPQDGVYNSESYDPQVTGYLNSRDLGLELTLRPLPSAGTPYYPLDLPVPGGAITGAGHFRWNLANCNPNEVSIGDPVVTENGSMKGPVSQGLRDLIDQDPEARWNPHAQRVISQFSEQSPRVFILLGFDPRRTIQPGAQTVFVTKLFAFFLESADASGNVTGRLAWLRKAGGASCATGGDFVVNCSSQRNRIESEAMPTEQATWGTLKATYR